MYYPVRFMVYLFVWAFFCAPAANAQLLQERDGEIKVSYGVYAGGFRALDVAMTLDSTENGYNIGMRAVPFGVIGSLLPWAGEYVTTGKIVKDTAKAPRLVPEKHAKISRWREDNDQDYFTYGKDGVLTGHKRIEILHSVRREKDIPLDPEFHKDSVDLLTGVVQMLVNVNSSGKGVTCDAAPVIFDGKRRFQLKFREIGTETLVKGKYNMTSGVARLCEIEMIPLTGFGDTPKGYYKIQEQARQRGQLPIVWVAPLWDGGPHLPVKLLVKSEYGSVYAHAQTASH